MMRGGGNETLIQKFASYQNAAAGLKSSPVIKAEIPQFPGAHLSGFRALQMSQNASLKKPGTDYRPVTSQSYTPNMMKLRPKF